MEKARLGFLCSILTGIGYSVLIADYRFELLSTNALMRLSISSYAAFVWMKISFSKVPFYDVIILERVVPRLRKSFLESLQRESCEEDFRSLFLEK